jgi:3D (Asp-Asp-Asp) domain-containing protein
MKKWLLAKVSLGAMLTGIACSEAPGEYTWKTIRVTVSAYNSVSWQTDSLHNIAAWGDTLRPGMKCIAVSGDLLRNGLVYNTPVKIEGLPGIYLVKDRMHPRWHNKIDIYMGTDVRAARSWGRKKRAIQYPVKTDSLAIPMDQ